MWPGNLWHDDFWISKWVVPASSEKSVWNQQGGEGKRQHDWRDKGIKICLSVHVLVLSDLRGVLIASIIIFIFPTYKLHRFFASLLLNVHFFKNWQLGCYYYVYFYWAFKCSHISSLHLFTRRLILRTSLVCISCSFTLSLSFSQKPWLPSQTLDFFPILCKWLFF